MHLFKFAAIALGAAVLAACGGGGGGPLGSQNSDPNRGTLMQTPVPRIAGVSAAEFTAMLNADATGQSLLQLAGNPVCGVDVNYIKYGTVGGAGERTNASGVVMVPTGSGAQCTGARPIVLYAHGTVIEKRYNLADWTDRTNPAFSESTLLAAMYAAQGYIVVAPNYVGYDSSTLAYHPYLNADQESKEMIDALSAAKLALPTLMSATTANTKLFITGYSQGGHVAMATHRAMQTLSTPIPVTASAPLSGPYALAAQSDSTFFGMVNAGGTVFSPMIFTSFQKAYGNLYSSPSDIYESAYATGIESLLPGTYNWTTLFTSGKLPQLALFSSTAPAGLAAQTPPTGTGATDAIFALGFGTNNLIKNSARQAYVADALANPDGVFPSVRSNPLASSTAASTLRQAAARNDLRGWTPTSPVLLCAGNGDPTVFYSLNTDVMRTLWAGLGPLVTTLDVDSAVTQNDTFAAVKAGFSQAKTSTFTAGGAAAVVNAYHGTLVPPFCNVAARGFFSKFL